MAEGRPIERFESHYLVWLLARSMQIRTLTFETFAETVQKEQKNFTNSQKSS